MFYEWITTEQTDGTDSESQKEMVINKSDIQHRRSAAACLCRKI